MRIRLFVAVMSAVLLARVVNAGIVPEFMSVRELKELLVKGPVDASFKTVVRGSSLTEYDIKLRGIVELPDVHIVVFTSKAFVAGGMSGSPVSVKGRDGRPKLLGAVAYRMTDFAVGQQWGGISPIEYMDAEARGTRASGGAMPPASFMYGGTTFKPIAIEPAVGAVQGTFLSGREWPLVPGMPITVDILEWTDQVGKSTTMSATGTITYIGPNGEIYAFGHPFLEARTARYNFRTCRIIDTVYSLGGSIKLAGEKSPVLGTIDYDGGYGIYGTVGNPDQRPVTEFHADFSRGGVPQASYRIRMATSPLTSLIMGNAFEIVGEAAKVPLPRQASTALFSSTVNVRGQESIEFSQVFTSTQFQFGPQTVYNSSYENAWGTFLEGIYIPLSISNFGFTLTDTRVRFDFTEGLAPNLNVATVRFPSKVTWGQNLVVELLLVSEDNRITLTKRASVPLDWDQIERPEYGADTRDTEKQAEKVVRGVLRVYTADQIASVLGDNEKETEFPPYFLGPEDYLANFRRGLGRSNRMLYARVVVRKRSGEGGLPKSLPDVSESASGQDGRSDDWIVSERGLQERKVTVLDEPIVRFPISLPAVPAGYIMATTNKAIPFEVVN